MRIIFEKNKLLLTVTVLLSVITSLGYVFIAYILKTVTDAAVAGDVDRLVRIAIQSAVYFPLMGGLGFLLNLCSRRLVTRIVKRMRKNVFEGILRRSATDFSQVNTADYLSALSNDIKLVEENGIASVLTLFQQGVIFIAALVYAFIISPVVGGVLSGSMLLMLILPGLFGARLQKLQTQQSDSLSKLTVFMKDVFSGYEIIKSYRMGSRINRDYEKINSEAIRTRIKTDTVITLSETLAEILAYLSLFSGFFVGAFLSINGNITAGAMLALIQLASSLLNPLMLAMQRIPIIQGVQPIFRRLHTFSDYRNTDETEKKPPHFTRTVLLDDVSFAYDDSRKILDNVRFSLRKGQKAAIVGPSGCGKTTLMRILSGEYGSYSGRVLFDDEDVSDVNKDKLCDLLSIIHQNVYLFDTTIGENIFLDQDFTPAQIDRALQYSGVDRFLAQNPDGLNAPVGENGHSLSGGQRQRIAVARALIREKPILIIDEGTSSVDMQTAYDIERSLFELDDLTLITVTHAMNEEILKNYDLVVYMDAGQIKESDTFDALIDKKGDFYRFYNWHRYSSSEERLPIAQ